MNWIDVRDRVPNNRRGVMAWGISVFLWGSYEEKDRFLGTTRFNMTKDGGEWDCEKVGRFQAFGSRVTHWAEIVSPAMSDDKTRKTLVALLEECETMLDEDFCGAAGLAGRIRETLDAVLQPNSSV